MGIIDKWLEVFIGKLLIFMAHFPAPCLITGGCFGTVGVLFYPFLISQTEPKQPSQSSFDTMKGFQRKNM